MVHQGRKYIKKCQSVMLHHILSPAVWGTVLMAWPHSLVFGPSGQIMQHLWDWIFQMFGIKVFMVERILISTS